MSTISTIVTKTVYAGVGAYTGGLLITGSGAITPTRYSATGLIAGPGVTGVRIGNQGHITGGSALNHAGSDGGSGVLLQDAALLTNSGTITGGEATYNNSGPAPFYGHGGTGIVLDAAAQVDNTSKISGGYGVGAYGGPGVYVSNGAKLTNSGTIEGGGAGGNYLTAAGYGGSVVNNGSLINSGKIIGGKGAFSPTPGGGYTYQPSGAGLRIFTGGKVTNFGTIEGSSGAAGNADGAFVGVAGTLINRGTIAGGTGFVTSGSSAYPFPFGSTGVFLDGGRVINAGAIVAGGGAGDTLANGGGVGVSIFAGTLANTGTISGAGTLSGGYDAPGVLLGSGTLYTSGLISTNGNASANLPQDAVLVDPIDTSATLVVEAGARFKGLVEAKSSGISILEFGGAIAARTGLLGTNFTGFSAIEVAGESNWTLESRNTISAGTAFLDNGTLIVAGMLQDNTVATVNGALDVASNGQARLSQAVLNNGTLAVTGQGRLAVGAGFDGAHLGAVTINQSAQVSGSGVILAPSGIADNGVISATAAYGGTLALMGNVSGTGLLNISAGATLTVAGNLSTAKLAFLAPAASQPTAGGTLVLTSTQAPTTVIQGFAGQDTIVLSNISANAFTFSNGTLTLEVGTTIVDTLKFAGNYTAANFSLFQSPGVGENITYSPGVLPPATPGHLALTETSLPAHSDSNAGWLNHLVS
jgi:hypothetical protein